MILQRRWMVGWCVGVCLASLCVSEKFSAAEETVNRLPHPDFTPDPSDPPWLATAAQFHGHLGPWAAAGLRLGMAARDAVGAEGYFDVEVEVFGPLDAPPRSCLIDGVQVATGATLGKRNIRWTQADALAVRVKNTRTGAVAVAHPTARLTELLGSFQPRPLVVRETPAGGGTVTGEPQRARGDVAGGSADRGGGAAGDHDADDDHDHEAAASPAHRSAQQRLERIARSIATAKAEEILRIEMRPSAGPKSDRR